MSGFPPPYGYNPNISQQYGNEEYEGYGNSQYSYQPPPANYVTSQAQHPMYQRGGNARALLEYYPTSASASSAPSGSNATYKEPWPIKTKKQQATYDMVVEDLGTRAQNADLSSRQKVGLKNALNLAIELDRGINCATFIAWLGSINFYLTDEGARKLFRAAWKSKKIERWPSSMSQEQRQRLDSIHKKLGTRKRGDNSRISDRRKILIGEIRDLAEEVFPCIDSDSVRRLLNSKGFYLGGKLSSFLPDKENEDLSNNKNEDIAEVARATLPNGNVIELGQWPENMGDEKLARFIDFKSKLGTRERGGSQEISNEQLEGYGGLFQLAKELFDNPTRTYFCKLLASIDFDISTETADRLEKRLAAKKAVQESISAQNWDEYGARSSSGYEAYGGARSSPAPGAQQSYYDQQRARFEHNLLPSGTGSSSSASNTINQGLWSGVNREKFTAMQVQLGTRKRGGGPVLAKQWTGIGIAFNLAIELNRNLTLRHFCKMLEEIGFYIHFTDTLLKSLFTAREQAAPQPTAQGHAVSEETALVLVSKKYPPIAQETRQIFPASEMSEAELQLFEKWLKTLSGSNGSDFLTDDQDTAIKRIFRGARQFHSKKYSQYVKFHDICDALEELVPTGPNRQLIWDTLAESNDVDDRDY